MTVIPFVCPTTFYLSGSTGSGKTWFLAQLLKYQDEMFVPHPPARIVYCYGVWQSLYEKMEADIKNIEFHRGLPTREEIKDLTSDKKHHMIILDDLMNQAQESAVISDAFTLNSHHLNVSICMISQVLFHRGKYARTLSLNSHYMIIFRNIRDKFAIVDLAKRMYPSQSHQVKEIFNDATKSPYSYLLLDLSPHSDDRYRLRAQILPHPNEETVVYTL